MAAAIGDAWGSQGDFQRAVPGKTDAAAELAGGREAMALVRQLATNPMAQPPQIPVKSPLAAIPLGLWFHDDETGLPATIRQVLGLGVDALMVGYAIAQILQKELELVSFVRQLGQWLSTWEPEHNLQPALEILDRALQERDPLERVVRNLAKNSDPHEEAILTALFCFLSTPDFPDLSICRAIQHPRQAALVGAVTGAFAGASNGVAKLPVKWEMALVETPLEQRWGVDSRETLRRCSVRLLAAWCGISPERMEAMAPGEREWTFPAVAAAGKLRA